MEQTDRPVADCAFSLQCGLNIKTFGQIQIFAHEALKSRHVPFVATKFFLSHRLTSATECLEVELIFNDFGGSS